MISGASRRRTSSVHSPPGAEGGRSTRGAARLGAAASRLESRDRPACCQGADEPADLHPAVRGSDGHVARRMGGPRAPGAGPQSAGGDRNSDRAGRRGHGTSFRGCAAPPFSQPPCHQPGTLQVELPGIVPQTRRPLRAFASAAKNALKSEGSPRTWRPSSAWRPRARPPGPP